MTRLDDALETLTVAFLFILAVVVCAAPAVAHYLF